MVDQYMVGDDIANDMQFIRRFSCPNQIKEEFKVVAIIQEVFMPFQNIDFPQMIKMSL